MGVIFLTVKDEKTLFEYTSVLQAGRRVFSWKISEYSQIMVQSSTAHSTAVAGNPQGHKEVEGTVNRL